MNEYFPKPKSLGVNVKVELDSFNHAVKAGFKYATGVDKSDFAKNTDLANLNSYVDKLNIDIFKNVPIGLSNSKSEVNKLDIGKLETTPFDSSKLSNVVKNDVIKKTEYSELV